MSTATLALALLLTTQVGTARQPNAPAPSASNQLEVPRCELTLIRQVQVPARQPGLLIGMLVEEGYAVKEGEELAQVDDSDAQLRKIAALREYEAAAEQAKEDVEAQAARAAAAVAKAEYESAQVLNKRAPGAVSPTELRRTELTAERAALQIKVANMEFSVAGHSSRAAQAKVEIIEHEILTRKIVAPFDGVVAAKHRQVGEWVQAGDPVLKLIQMDRLRVQGVIKADKFAPHEIEGKPVRILVKLPGDKVHPIDGYVDYVSQVVEASDEYRIWAEIDNVPVVTREEKTFWLMGPGMEASMTIDMSGEAAAVANRTLP